MKRILLLGGVTEALAIARTLGPQHIYSLAGVGRVPTDLKCQVRVGGYGGAEGLAQFIRDERVDLLLDATHPYAAQISQNAASAAQLSGIPCWALRRPAWQPQPGDDWREVSDWAELIEALKPFRKPLFTLGREPLQHLDEIPADQFWTLRALDVYPGNERCEVIGARGPFLIDDERELFERRQIDVLISKNSGSTATEPKLEVARERGVPVIVLKRPVLPGLSGSLGRFHSYWTPYPCHIFPKHCRNLRIFWQFSRKVLAFPLNISTLYSNSFNHPSTSSPLQETDSLIPGKALLASLYPKEYDSGMIDFERSRVFADWLDSLRDTIGKARIIARLRAAEHGSFGDCVSVGASVYEMRVHHGPGYRVYFTRRDEVVYLLLIGGDKSTQKRDIKRAIQMAQNIGNEE